ncbi:MAG: flagellar motor protein MotB [Saprospiraceae bacterium]|jgi:flagellar motor protein MotB
MRLIIIPILFFIGLTTSAQIMPPVDVLPDALNSEYQKAEQLLLMKEYEKALKSFQKILKRKPKFIPALRGAGACYELMLEYEDAAKLYDQAITINDRFSRALFYETADAHFKSGNYYMALELFMEFDTLRNYPDGAFSYNGGAEKEAEASYYQKVSRNIRGCHVAMDSIKFWNIPSVLNIGDAINTKGDEVFPFLANNQEMMFFTRRRSEFEDENLFISMRPTEKWRIAQAANKEFNTEFNEGMATFVRDGRQMFFTACQRKGILGTCDVWKGQMDGEKVKETGPVIGYINSGDWDSQASINCDGTIIFFASNREGGQGGTDIWMSNRLSDGRWGPPKNLGDKVNTEGDEEAPFITNDGNTLYFSSTGHLGLGEQDIFMTKWDGMDGWEHPVNLGIPVNSSYRELGFFLSADGKTGYFSSNRKGGFGGMDIYQFDLSEQLFSEPITFVEGYVRDSILKTPIKTTVHFKNRLPVQTDENGRFFICARAGETLEFDVRADEYHPYNNTKFVSKWDNKVFFPLDINLNPLFRLPTFAGELDAPNSLPVANKKDRDKCKKIRHTILFSFDEATLKPEMKEELNAFLNEVFDGIKTVKNVSVIGFSDDIGGDAYNMILSEKRAKSVGVYLKEKGIRVDKIFIEGRGELNSTRSKKENRKVELVVSIEE